MKAPGEGPSCYLVGAFSVIVKTGCGTDGALHSTSKFVGLWLEEERWPAQHLCKMMTNYIFERKIKTE